MHSKARPRAEMEQRQALSLPTLPPEILAIVISKLSLFDWSFVDLDHSNPWNPFISSSTNLEDNNKICIATKRALCLVSRQLCAMTRPLLYEYIWIRTPRALYALAEPIIFGQEPEGSTGLLAKNTRRLDISLGSNADASPGPIYIAASVLLRCCAKNLTHLSISLLMKDAVSLVHDVQLCTELSVLCWRFMPLHSTTSADILSGLFNNLVVLDLTELATMPSEEMLQDVIDFPHLHTLRFSVCEMIEDFTRMVLPSLRVLDIEELPLRYDFDTARSASAAFIQRHGFKLQTLIIRTNIPRIRLVDTPDLQYLAICLEGTGIFDEEFTMRSLEHIGILLPPQVTGKHIISLIHNKISARRSDFPALMTMETFCLTTPFYSHRDVCARFPN